MTREAVQNSEGQRRHGEKVHGSDSFAMVSEKCQPARGRHQDHDSHASIQRETVRSEISNHSLSNFPWMPWRSPGRPGDLHPESPTDPDVNLSIHPARVTPRKPAGFRQDKEFLRLPVDSILTRVTCPLCSTGITPLPRYYEAVRP